MCIECQNDWSGYNDSCWSYFPDPSIWQEAKEKCTYYNATLLTLDSVEKFNFFYNQFSKVRNPKSTSAWLDSSTNVPLTFKWPNGAAINKSFWGGNNPTNSGGTDKIVAEGCLSFSKFDFNKLNDAECSVTLDYFCESKGEK